MGFHAVATGYLIKKHGTVCDTFHVVARGLRRKDTGVFIQHREEINDILTQDISDFQDLLDNDWEYEPVWYEDIQINKHGQAVYRHNHRFKVGESHICAVMIYLSVVGDDLGGELRCELISDQQLTQLMQWKKQLAKAGRIRTDVRFTSIHNCCS